MAGGTEQPQPCTGMGRRVIEEGGGRGFPLLEAVARSIGHCTDVAVDILYGRPQVCWPGRPDPRIREQWLANLRATADRNNYDIRAWILDELEAGALALVGTHEPWGVDEHAVAAEALECGQLDWVNETLTADIDGHTLHYTNLRLVPQTEQQRKRLRENKTARHAAFIAAMDSGEIDWLPDTANPKIRVIATTKAETYRVLTRKHPKLFGAETSFNKAYARGGEGTRALGFTLKWSRDKAEQ